MTEGRPAVGSILWYLGITFVITWGVEGVLIARGVSFVGFPPQYAQLVVASVMWVPALGAFLAARICGETVVPYGWRFGRFPPYLVVGLATPVVFFVAYGATVLLDLGRLDLTLASFFEQMARATGQPVPQIPDPRELVAVLFVVTTFLTPFINTLFGLGEEIGWRGFLLPRLLPLGKPRAYLLSGIIWGLWHAPLVLMGFAFPGFPIAGIVLFIVFTTIMGTILNELALRYRSVILAGFGHGVFNSQGYGIWKMIVPASQPLLGGMPGLVGLVALAVTAGIVVQSLRTGTEGGYAAND